MCFKKELITPNSRKNEFPPISLLHTSRTGGGGEEGHAVSEYK